MTYPILQGRLINTIPFFTDLSKEGTYVEGPAIIEKTTVDFVSPFNDWEEEARVIVKVGGSERTISSLGSLITSPGQYMKNPSRWAVQTVNPLHTYVSKRVMLMGDAVSLVTSSRGTY